MRQLSTALTAEDRDWIAASPLPIAVFHTGPSEPDTITKARLLAAAGCSASGLLVELYDDRRRLQAIVTGLAERVAAQSELLSRRAEPDRCEHDVKDGVPV